MLCNYLVDLLHTSDIFFFFFLNSISLFSCLRRRADVLYRVSLQVYIRAYGPAPELTKYKVNQNQVLSQ